MKDFPGPIGSKDAKVNFYSIFGVGFCAPRKEINTSAANDKPPVTGTECWSNEVVTL